ncbi:MAG: amidase [Bryobacterales bacterium]|nr:amidase [Bryobacterales bacterium]
MDDLNAQPAYKIADLIRKREVSPIEVVDTHLKRIEQVNPSLNAFVDLDAERVRREARKAEEILSRSDGVGPLHGVPMSIKSSIEVQGLRCECGTRLREEHIAESDAVLVERLRAAGALILGVTNVPDLLAAYETDNLLYGRTNSPWNPDYTAGGSSGGESAAVASGCSALGIGSDGGGSIRVPAHFCGLYGFKPTAGLIPRTGHWPDCIGPSALLASVGPLARSAFDLELVLDATMGEDAADPSSGPYAPEGAGADLTHRVKIGFYEDDGVTPVTSETKQAVRDACNVFEDQGFSVEPFSPEGLESAHELWWMLFSIAGAERLQPLIEGKEDQLHALVQDLLEPPEDSRRASLREFLQVWDTRDLMRAQFLARMQEYRALICPVASIPAFRHRERSWTISGREVTYAMAFSYCQVFNLLGNPSVVVPVGHSNEGLPIGVQIVGRPFEDRLILALAERFEQVVDAWKPPPEPA